MMLIRFFLLFFCSLNLIGKPIETFYGTLDITEPVLLELIQSPAFQRLKHIHQYGVSYYTTHREEFTRYDHSLGVFYLLRKNGTSLEEQIAGLLHDISHTVFSHVGDFLFKKAYKEVDYQNSIHEIFLETVGIGTILRKYGLEPKDVLPLGKLFPALENPRPNLSADRLDYSIQGAYHQNFITYEEALEIFHDCRWIDNAWVATRSDLMEKLVRFTLFMTEDCFGSVTNHLSSIWLSDAIWKSIECKIISENDIHFGTDTLVWEKLLSAEDPFIQNRMEMVFAAQNLYENVSKEKADLVLVTKFWGFDPWIMHEGKLVRLTFLNETLKRDYDAVKARIVTGFSIKLLTQEKALAKSS